MKIPGVLSRALFARRPSCSQRLLMSHPHAPFSARVMYIPDGDGLTVSLNSKTISIRLFGMDAPERGQHYFQQSRSFLASQIGTKPVMCFPVDTDPYGRLVCDCFGLGKFSLSLLSVFFGYAWHYRFFAPQENDLATAQRLAKMYRRGLWLYPNPIAPWDFRRHQSKKGCRHAR